MKIIVMIIVYALFCVLWLKAFEKITKEYKFFEKRDIIKVDDKHFLVSTVKILDCGYETMAFRCDSEGNVKNWSELYCDRYKTRYQAKKGHKRAIRYFKEGSKNG